MISKSLTAVYWCTNPLSTILTELIIEQTIETDLSHVLDKHIYKNKIEYDWDKIYKIRLCKIDKIEYDGLSMDGLLYRLTQVIK